MGRRKNFPGRSWFVANGSPRFALQKTQEARGGRGLPSRFSKNWKKQPAVLQALETATSLCGRGLQPRGCWVLGWGRGVANPAHRSVTARPVSGTHPPCRPGLRLSAPTLRPARALAAAEAEPAAAHGAPPAAALPQPQKACPTLENFLAAPPRHIRLPPNQRARAQGV